MAPATTMGVHPRPLSMVVHFLALVSFVFVLIWAVHFRGGIAYSSTNKNLIFNVHPVLMVLGFVVFASEAILTYRILPWSKPTRKLIHLTLQGIALVLACVGIAAAFKYHNESNIDNLYSLHSWLGLGATILFGIQWLMAFFSFFYPGIHHSGRSALLPWHVFFGLFIYGLIITTVELGFLEKLTFLQQSSVIGKYSSEAMFVNSLAVIVAVLAGFVVLAATVPDHKDDDYRALE